jgi:DNA-binding transcriptional ArsR family regulator
MPVPVPLSAHTADSLADRFRLLSEPTRLRLLYLLRDGERSVGALAAEIGCTQANASRQLALLADGGVLVRRREGLHCYYTVGDGSVFALCDAVCESLTRHIDARADALRPLR